VLHAPNQSRLRGRQRLAVIKLTRCPRRAQLHPTPAFSGIIRPRKAPMKHHAARLPPFTRTSTLLNLDFEQVPADLTRLRELGAFQRDLGIFFASSSRIGEPGPPWRWSRRCKIWEQDNWAHFCRLRRRWEQKQRPPRRAYRSQALMGRRRARSGAELDGRRMSGTSKRPDGGLAPVRNPAG